jgi:two-component system, NtrC family, sensor kinase
MNENWRSVFGQVMERVRTIGASDLLPELELLKVRYEEEREQDLLEAKRRMADLEEIHNANRLVTVGTLTVGMAHEFGTPLGVVLARAQMIVADEDDTETRKDAEEIIQQVKRMTRMCREVLDYARPKAPAKLPVDVVQLARQMIVLLLPDARMRNAKLILADNPPGLVLGDSSKLMQVFTNLIINAAQAMPKGGTVRLSVERKRVRPSAVQGLAEADYICVHVQDGGTGIRSADLPHIFDTFFTTKIEGEGTGLGLAVSYRIAREHGGWIDVVTKEGEGSTFTLYLPPLGASLTEHEKN